MAKHTRPTEPAIETPEVSATEQLRLAAEREMTERTAACAAAVNQVLADHGFELDPVISIGVKGVVGARIGFVATR